MTMGRCRTGAFQSFTSFISTPDFIKDEGHQSHSYPNFLVNLGIVGFHGDPDILNKALKHLSGTKATGHTRFPQAWERSLSTQALRGASRAVGFFQKPKMETTEEAQWLRILALVEDLGSVPSMHVAAHSHPVLEDSRPPSCSVGTTHM